MMKTVLITGGAKRLGKTMAERFGEAGWHVIIHCNTSRDAADSLAATLPSAEVVQCDISDPLAAADMIRSLAKSHDDWRCLINNASTFKSDEVTGLDPETNHLNMSVNAVSPARMAQAFFNHARSKDGRRVIQFTDMKLKNLNPDFFSYTMSKAATDVAARMLAMANGGEDRVYTIAPGAILPSHDQTQDEADRSHTLNLLGRRTHASEIADAALFMAEGPLASGQTIYVDSGQHLLSQDRDVIYLEREGASQ